MFSSMINDSSVMVSDIDEEGTQHPMSGFLVPPRGENG